MAYRHNYDDYEPAPLGVDEFGDPFTEHDRVRANQEQARERSLAERRAEARRRREHPEDYPF